MSTSNDDHDETQPGVPDYLWDKSGAPDPEVVALESALASRRWSGRLPESAEPVAGVPLPRRDRLLRLLPRALAASLIAAAVLFGGLALWHGLMEPHARDPAAQGVLADAPSPYSIEGSDGSFHIEDARPSDGALVPGSRLVTQADAVRLRVGPIGSVTVEPDTRLRIEEPARADDGGYLLWLERGTISASIFAAPRLFQLGTPSGIAVDMGCAYTASVDEAGATRLAVTLGQVSFETPQRKVLVPEGASARAWPGRGPGTPVWDDAAPEFRAAVERFDELAAATSGEAGPDATAALATVLGTERAQDSLSLWHLLDVELDGALRAELYDRLAALAPPPEGVTREGCLARDRAQLDTWRDALGWAWPATTSPKSKGLKMPTEDRSR